MSETTVITAIYGGRDKLRAPSIVRPDVDYVCYTDDCGLRHNVWDCRYVPPSHQDPCRSAKRFKVLSHLYVDSRQSIWIDASSQLLCDPVEIFNEFTEALALVRHWRHCIYHEARACRRRCNDQLQLIESAVRHYRESRHPPRWGLWYGTALFRRHTPEMAQFNEAWWAQIERYTRRDQISLPVILHRTGIPFHTFSRSELRRLFRMGAHAR